MIQNKLYDVPEDTIPHTLAPAPGVTKRKKEPPTTKEKPKRRPRKLLTVQELAEEEIRLEAKYPHLVGGSLLNATKDVPMAGLTTAEICKFHHKRSCLIKCTCGVKRRIATSDLAQVTLCPGCTRDERNRRKRERRAAKSRLYLNKSR